MAYSVLIVDDSPVMRKYIRKVINLSGLEMGACFDANNGEEALTLLQESWVDIILTDINMPVMNGEEFLRQVSQDPLLSTIPVVVVSTDRSESRWNRMKALGAREYITKPLFPETLGDTMLEILSRGDYAAT